MKNLKYICLLLTGALVFSACEDDDKKPWVLEEVVGNQGAFMRVIDVPSPTFNLFDIPNSEFSIVLEAFDGQDGALVESVSFNVDFIDQTSFNGTVETDVAELGTIPASAFVTDPETGLPRVTATFSAPEVISALGITNGDIEGTDRFRFEWTLNLTNGRSFNRETSSNSVEGETFYSSPFLQDVNVICVIADDVFTGNYTYEPVTVGGFGVPPFGDNPTPVTVESRGGTTRAFSIQYLPQFVPTAPPAEFTFDIVCSNTIPVNEQNTGIGCGGAILIGAPDPDDFAFIDPGNEDEIFITFLDAQVDPGCGLAPTPFTIRLFR